MLFLSNISVPLAFLPTKVVSNPKEANSLTLLATDAKLVSNNTLVPMIPWAGAVFKEVYIQCWAKCLAKLSSVLYGMYLLTFMIVSLSFSNTTVLLSPLSITSSIISCESSTLAIDNLNILAKSVSAFNMSTTSSKVKTSKSGELTTILFSP